MPLGNDGGGAEGGEEEATAAAADTCLWVNDKLSDVSRGRRQITSRLGWGGEGECVKGHSGEELSRLDYVADRCWLQRRVASAEDKWVCGVV